MMSRELPKVYNAHDVRATLEGRKTQFRKTYGLQEANASPDEWEFFGWCEENVEHAFVMFVHRDSEIRINNRVITGNTIKCTPLYQVGDLLWVKETHAIYQTVNYIKRPDGRAFSEYSDGLVAYKADGYESIDDLIDYIRQTEDLDLESVYVKDGKWFSRVSMPKWAARLWLRVESVHVERLCDISEADAIAEGVEFLFTQEQCNTGVGLKGTTPIDHGYKNYLWHGNADKGLITNKQADSWDYQFSNYTNARDSFSSLWEMTKSRKESGWHDNPWVFVYNVVAFKRC